MIAIDMGMARPKLRHVTCWGFHGGKRQTHQSRLQSRFSVQPAQVHGASLSNIASSPDSHQTEPRPGWFSDFFGFFHLARQKKVKKSGPNRSKTIEIRKFTKKLRTHVPRLIIRRSHAAVRAGRDWPGSDRPAPHQVAGILPLRAENEHGCSSQHRPTQANRAADRVNEDQIIVQAIADHRAKRFPMLPGVLRISWGHKCRQSRRHHPLPPGGRKPCCWVQRGQSAVGPQGPVLFGSTGSPRLTDKRATRPCRQMDLQAALYPMSSRLLGPRWARQAGQDRT
jgi:hypothetical protein